MISQTYYVIDKEFGKHYMRTEEKEKAIKFAKELNKQKSSRNVIVQREVLLIDIIYDNKHPENETKFMKEK